MLLVILGIALISEYKVSCEFKCRTKGCIGQKELNGQWESFFKGQEHTPCLKFSHAYYCFTKDLHMKQCQCYEEDLLDSYPNEWCNPQLYGEAHTMCIYDEYKEGHERCGKTITRGILTQADKDKIVAHHNKLRAKIANGEEKRGLSGPQPPAANMRMLTWNDDLALVAQRWVDQCPRRPHDVNRRTDEYQFVGQNYAWRSKTTDTQEPEILTMLIDNWYNEVKDMREGEVESFFSTHPVTGHYTQLAWAKTHEIGCGFLSHRRHEGGPLISILVCNYGPQGNAIEKQQYIIGEPASKCPFGTKPTEEPEFSGLCELNQENLKGS